LSSALKGIHRKQKAIRRGGWLFAFELLPAIT